MSDALLYAGRVNALNGESGSGKSWVAMLACAELMKNGDVVVYVDLEDHPVSVVARFRALGVPDSMILKQLVYIRPDRKASEAALASIDRVIVERRVALVVIDSIGELMALHGVKPNDDDDVARLYRAIPRRWAALGACVLLIDHVPKNNDSPLYGIGSQRKRAAIDGASYMVETIRSFAAGHDGVLKLVVAKDRNGTFPTGSVAAMVDVSSVDGAVTLDVKAPESTTDGDVRQTSNMAKISRWLMSRPGRRGHRNAMKADAVVTAKHLSTALNQLADEGWVTRIEHPDSQKIDYVLVEPFDEMTIPPRDRVPPGSTGFQPGS